MVTYVPYPSTTYMLFSALQSQPVARSHLAGKHGTARLARPSFGPSPRSVQLSWANRPEVLQNATLETTAGDLAVSPAARPRIPAEHGYTSLVAFTSSLSRKNGCHAHACRGHVETAEVSHAHGKRAHGTLSVGRQNTLFREANLMKRAVVLCALSAILGGLAAFGWHGSPLAEHPIRRARGITLAGASRAWRATACAPPPPQLRPGLRRWTRSPPRNGSTCSSTSRATAAS